MWTVSKLVTFESSHRAKGREYLKESPNCLGKKTVGSPLYVVIPPRGAAGLSTNSGLVVASNTSTSRARSARHIGTMACAGPPDRSDTDGITWRTFTEWMSDKLCISCGDIIQPAPLRQHIQRP